MIPIYFTMKKSEKKPAYRYCIVPECKNTVRSTPNKVFFEVPRGTEIRKEWCKVIRRGEISPTSCLHCCEDHFNIKEDTMNYMQYKIMKQEGVKVTLRLKKGVLPHKFHCRNQNMPYPVAVVKIGAIKRKRLPLVEEPDAISSNIFEICDPLQTIYSVAGPSTFYVDESTLLEYENQILIDEAVDMNIKCEYESDSEGVQAKVYNIENKNISLSPLEWSLQAISPGTSLLKPIVKQEMFSDSADCLSMASSSAISQEYDPSCSSGSSGMSDSNDSENEKDFKNLMCTGMLTAIEKEPKMLLGLPKESYNLIRLLSENIPIPTIDILITLKKIKLNDSFSILAIHFGYSQSTISRIFFKSVSLIADKLKDFIVWPEPQKIYHKIPISFRSRYTQVVSIIDCFEIQIEKPSDPVHQLLTWSHYKKCNTIKYLISCTPDGLITFVSDGYGGRTTDVTIVEDCGYLECLPPNRGVMADRGFENLSCLLQSKRCTLIQPPSVSKLSSTVEVKPTKQIAARLPTEHVISRLREFHMLLPHACVEQNLIPIINEVVIIASSIINMQS